MILQDCKDAETVRGARPAAMRAPDDCSDAATIRDFTAAVRCLLRSGAREVRIDLSPVRTMNAYLLGAILQLVREASGAGIVLKVDNATEDFLRWARVFGLLRPLERRGILS